MIPIYRTFIELFCNASPIVTKVNNLTLDYIVTHNTSLWLGSG